MRFVQASGPGGQNVDKVATAARLRFDAPAPPSLPDEVKAWLQALAGQRITPACLAPDMTGADGSQPSDGQPRAERRDAYVLTRIAVPTGCSHVHLEADGHPGS